MKKRKTDVMLCPKCDTVMVEANGESITVAGVKETDTPKEKYQKATLPKTAQQRIEALRNAGVDVSGMFAMKGANGGEYVASNQNGQLLILEENDPIFKQIIQQGTVPNRRLFRRWVMAQMFHMLSATSYNSDKPLGVTRMIHRLGYDYQWKMLLNELEAQVKMEKCDPVNFADRNRWFNKDVAVAMAKDYIEQLRKMVDALAVKHCKKIPYKRIAGRNIFVSDLNAKLYSSLNIALSRIKNSKNIVQLYNTTKAFCEMRIRLKHDAHQCKAWVDSYKGAGAFFTMQNLIRFHNCTAIDDAGKRLNKPNSLIFIEQKAKMYSSGEGWRLLATMKKMLDDNNIDIKQKQAEWRVQ